MKQLPILLVSIAVILSGCVGQQTTEEIQTSTETTILRPVTTTTQPKEIQQESPTAVKETSYSGKVIAGISKKVCKFKPIGNVKG